MPPILRSLLLSVCLLSPALAGPTGGPRTVIKPPAPTTSAPATQAARDFSSPEATLKTFADAIALHDADTLAACFEKTDASDKVTPRFMDVVLSSVRLRHAGAEKFGPEAAERFDFTPSMTAMLDLGRQAAIRPRIHVEVGTARVTVNKDVALILHQEERGWFIDPSSFVQVKPGERANADDALPLLRAIATCLSESAAEVTAGKYKSAADASLAIRIRFAKDTRAATQPATQPK